MSGNYTEDMLNVNAEVWKKVLDRRTHAERGAIEEEEEEEAHGEVEFVSDDEDLMSDDEEFNDWLEGGGEAESNLEVSVDEEEEEEEEGPSNGKRKILTNENSPRRKVARVEVEYEEEHEGRPQKELVFA